MTTDSSKLVVDMSDWYMPTPAVGVVAEQIRKFVDERDYVSPIEMAHWILDALEAHHYMHAEYPSNVDCDSASSWVMPLNSVHTTCLGATHTGRVCHAPLTEIQQRACR